MRQLIHAYLRGVLFPAGRAPAVHLALPPPALIKPRPLWTGKQLISSVVEHFADGRPPLTFSSGSKVGVLPQYCYDNSQFSALSVCTSSASWCSGSSNPSTLLV